MFKTMNEEMQQHFAEMHKTGLFTVNVDKVVLWDKYLKSFSPEDNPLYITNSVHDCNCCRHFVKQFGNVVTIKDGKIISLWDFTTSVPEYQASIKAMSEYIHEQQLDSIYLHYDKNVGTGSNFKLEEDGRTTEFNHFAVTLPTAFICNKDSIASRKGEFVNNYTVFKNSLDKITIESLNTVLELIDQNNLYRGKSFEATIKKFKEVKEKNLTDIELFAVTSKYPESVTHFKNSSIGTLLVDISSGTPLDEAVKAFEKMVAPENYKRPAPIFTVSMLEAAKKDIEDLGYAGSLIREFAKPEQISINEVLFVDRDVAPVMKNASNNPLDILQSKTPASVTGKVIETGLEDFIRTAAESKKLEILFDHNLTNNLVSVIGPGDESSKSLFPWENNFSWSYKNNVTDSIKQNVQKAGGKVDGVLRFSIQWNDSDIHNTCDYDAHCKLPNEHHIFFRDKLDTNSKGKLDVDIIDPMPGIPAVENITWPFLNIMPEGEYTFYVNPFDIRSGNVGFSAEIEFEGKTFNFVYDQPVTKDVVIAKVTLKDGKFSINSKLPHNSSTKTIWELTTGKFYPVSMIMNSPNFWATNKGPNVGNKHYFFIINDCKNSDEPSGFFNEFLKPELAVHKKVFAALSGLSKVKPADTQLSGLGFSETIHTEFIIKADNQLYKVRI